MLLEATDVRQVRVGELTEADAVAAGEGTLATLLTRLEQPDARRNGVAGRVSAASGVDDRIERREQRRPHRRRHRRAARAARPPRRALAGGPWTRTTLQLIEKYPGVVSTALARHAEQERPAFKINVRKLKEMGLTESLEVGYRLSPRGDALLRAIG